MIAGRGLLMGWSIVLALFVLAPSDGQAEVQLQSLTVDAGGGREASSPTYRANLTISGSPVGVSTSTNYQAELGFWRARPIPERPNIQSVTDIGNDQGRNVRVIWTRDKHDSLAVPDPVVEYLVWRRVDGIAATSTRPVHRLHDVATALRTSDDHDVLLNYAATLWEPVGLRIPAMTWDEYASVVPTLADSTAELGVHYSVFFVSAHTPVPQLIYKSKPDSGYSVDNLAPGAPLNLSLDTPGEVQWDSNPEPDLGFYSVYARPDSVLSLVGADSLGQTADTTFALPAGAAGQYILVTARDFAGNQSQPSSVVRNTTDVINVAFTPNLYRLYQNAPNPFNAVTEIRFDLPLPGHVEMTIHDVTGRTVRTLVSGSFEAGGHVARWDGRDGRGAAVASGVYLTRIQADGFQSIRKMLFLR